MNKIFERIEHFVDRVIPYLLAAIIIVVMVEFFNKELAETYHSQIVSFDYVVVTFFVVDLAFKYNRVRDVPRFLKLYWLDILAVFPFVLALRLFSEAILISEELVSASRNLFHAGVIIEEAATTAKVAEITNIEKIAKISETERAAKAFETIAKEESLARAAEVISKEGRFARLERLIRPLERTPRLFKALSFYEHPKERKTSYH